MDVSEAKRLKALEEENAKLKKLLADQMLEAAALRELLGKKMVGSRRQARSRSAPSGRHGPVGASGRHIVVIDHKRRNSNCRWMKVHGQVTDKHHFAPSVL